MRTFPFWLILSGLLSFARAEQPIFNEMPRWNGGYGIQVLEVFRRSKEQEPSGDIRRNEFLYTRVEGVYTWRRWIRLTSKLRVLNHRTVNDAESEDAGPTDLRLALPLKAYFNLDGRSGSYTLTPELTLPLTDQNHGQNFIGSRRYGLSAGYETETYYYHLGVGASIRKQERRRDLQYELSASTGLNGFFIGFPGHLKAEIHYNEMGGGHDIIRIGPTLYGQVNDEWHWQVKWHRAVYARYRRMGVLEDAFVSLGIAFVQ